MMVSQRPTLDIQLRRHPVIFTIPPSLRRQLARNRERERPSMQSIRPLQQRLSCWTFDSLNSMVRSRFSGESDRHIFRRSAGNRWWMEERNLCACGLWRRSLQSRGRSESGGSFCFFFLKSVEPFRADFFWPNLALSIDGINLFSFSFLRRGYK